VESGLQSSIDVQKNRISLVVSGTGSNASIKAASIVTSINNAGSSVAISANHVTISGTTTINDILGITDQRVYIKSNARINGDAMMESITLRDGSDSLTVNESTLKGMVKSFSVSGNTLTLTPFHGNPVNFSKATTLNGAWSSGTLTVTASPQGNSFTMGLSNGTASWDTGVCTIPIRYSKDGSSTEYTTGHNAYAYVNTSDIGFDQLSLKPSTESTSGRTSAGSFSKSNLAAPGYIFFRVGCHGRNKLYYITVNP